MNKVDGLDRLGIMDAEVISMKTGLQMFDHVSLIRIISSRFNLLIMEDYLPVIGEIEGDVCIMSQEEEYRLERIRGFFCHRSNRFSLMLREE